MSDDDHGRMLLGRGWAITCEDDGRVARLHLPPLELPGVRKPVNIYLDMGAEHVDALLQQLAEIRTQMVPAPTRKVAQPVASPSAVHCSRSLPLRVVCTFRSRLPKEE